METPALTFILCCFNSEERIAAALQPLAEQDLGEAYEVIVIDNGSTDATYDVAVDRLARLFPRSGKTVRETRRGRMHALLRGVREAAGEIVCFVDDDNWLDRAYGSSALRFFRSHPAAGAVGGESRLPDGMTVQPWFGEVRRSYAVGPQARAAGRLDADASLWGAGLAVRRQAFVDLLQRGWQPALLGRAGGVPTSGDDSEIVAAIRLLGWEAWYAPELTLQHAIAPERIEIGYVLRLFEGFGRASPALLEYRALLRGDDRLRRGLRRARKVRIINAVFASLRYVALRVKSMTRRRSIRSAAEAAYWLGQLKALAADGEVIRRARTNAALCAAAATHRTDG